MHTQADNGRQKLDTLTEALSMNVEERCQCGFTVMNILKPTFRCFVESEDAVTYRAEILGTGVASAADITSHIQDWITQGALITFDFILIAVDGSCPAVVASVQDPECSIPSETSQPSVLGGVLGGVLVVILLVFIVITILIVYCWIHRKRSGKLKISKDRYVGVYQCQYSSDILHLQEGNRAGPSVRESNQPARRRI